MQEFIDSLRRMFTLNADYLRLRLAEKISDALSTALIYVCIAAAALVAMLFLSFGVGFLLAEVMPLWAAFMCVAILYALGAVPLVVFRRKLFVDGISRVVSRLLLNPPKQEDEKN